VTFVPRSIDIRANVTDVFPSPPQSRPPPLLTSLHPLLHPLLHPPLHPPLLHP
ncbi:hypothetical protein M9458_032982, partial [Cirrhinus mrigala]